MNNTTVWDETPCGLVEIHLRFEGTDCFHLQGRRVSQARGGTSGFRFARCLALFGLLLDLIFGIEDEDSAFLRNIGKNLPKDTEHGIIPQKILLFMSIRLFLVSDACEQEM